jgi:Flp pilus assembly protein TadB
VNLRSLLLVGVLAWAGGTLVLGEVRRLDRVPLAVRVGRHVLGGAARTRSASPPDTWAAGALRDAILTWASSAGDRLSRAVGITEELSIRLERVHSPHRPAAFRTRQLGAALAAMAAGAAVAAATGPPAAITLLLLLGSPALAFLVLEQGTVQTSREWQRRLAAELPTITEQLGMLLGAGYSLGGAIDRLGRRGSGACATDLARVAARLRHGVGAEAALAEWAALARVDSLDRLVAVLALDREAADLGRLISEEARSMRRERHRELLEAIERRSQQVWIPVTVATLVPGVLFLAVPFVQAMRLFTTT